MGVLYETYQSMNTKKRCTLCGCIMDADHVGDVCEVCLDDLYEIDPTELTPEEIKYVNRDAELVRDLSARG